MNNLLVFFLITICSMQIYQVAARTIHYRSLKPIDIPVRVIYDDPQIIHKRVEVPQTILPKRHGYINTAKSKMALPEDLVTNLPQETMKENPIVRVVAGEEANILNKESNIDEVVVKPDGSPVEELPPSKPLIENEKAIENEVSISNQLRNSEDHPAQVPIFKAKKTSSESSTKPPAISSTPAGNTTNKGPFASIQQAFSNAINSIRPQNLAQVVINRLTSNKNQDKDKNKEGVVQKVKLGMEDNIDNPPKQEEASTAKPEVTSKKPNRPILSGIQQAVNNVANRFSTTTKNSISSTTPNSSTLKQQVQKQQAEEPAQPAAPPAAENPAPPNYVVSLQNNFNDQINNFREQVNNAFNNLRPTPPPGSQSDETPSRPILDTIQQNVNNGIDGFTNNVNNIFTSVSNNQQQGTQNDPGNNNGEQNIFQSFQNNIQQNLQQLTQNFFPSSTPPSGTQGDEQQQTNNPIQPIQTAIQNGFSQFVTNINQAFQQQQSGSAQNDESSQPNPVQGLVNNFNNFVSQFRPESQSATVLISPPQAAPIPSQPPKIEDSKPIPAQTPPVATSSSGSKLPK